MKKLFFLLAVIGLFASCNAKNNQQQAEEETAPAEKSLVVFFSASGITKGVATQLAETMNADLWEIEPAEVYTEEDLDWRNAESRSSLEMKDPEARPMIKACTDISSYNKIFIGFPIWWNVCPRIINSWIDNNLLEGKTLIPFATSGGSTIDGSMEYLRATYPDLDLHDGKLLNNADSTMLNEWKAELEK